MYKAEIIADSKSPQGDRLTTFVVNYPRIVHGEMMTHRMFSRNSASSRAIPFKKMVKMVEENPFIPIAWQKDHKGMQGTEYLVDRKHENAVYEWLKARDYAVKQANMMNNDGVTKQLCNRLLEVFMWHKVIITSSEEGLMNFFNLRCPQYKSNDFFYKSKKDYIKSFCGEDYVVQQSDITDNEWNTKNKSQADIHIQAIAELMWDCYNESKPKQLKAEDWHIPFGDNINLLKLFKDPPIKGATNLCQFTIDGILPAKVKIATARCARISYNNFEGKDDYEADIKLYDRLAKSGHWSCFEHCARAMSNEEYYSYIQGKVPTYIDSYGDLFNAEQYCSGEHKNNANYYGWCRNFKGFIQLREIQENN